MSTNKGKVNMTEERFNQIKALAGNDVSRSSLEKRKQVAALANVSMSTVNKIAQMDTWEDYEQYKKDVVNWKKSGGNIAHPMYSESNKAKQAEQLELDEELGKIVDVPQKADACERDCECTNKKHDPTSPEALLMKAMLENEALRAKEIKMSMRGAIAMTALFGIMMIYFAVNIILSFFKG